MIDTGAAGNLWVATVGMLQKGLQARVMSVGCSARIMVYGQFIVVDAPNVIMKTLSSTMGYLSTRWLHRRLMCQSYTSW